MLGRSQHRLNMGPVGRGYNDRIDIGASTKLSDAISVTTADLIDKRACIFWVIDSCDPGARTLRQRTTEGPPEISCAYYAIANM